MKRMILFFMSIIVFLGNTLSAAELVKVEDILKDSQLFNNKIVGMIGVVSQFEKKTNESKACYFFRDNFGVTIKIVTENELPELDTIYEVRGIVITGDSHGETKEKEVYIAEMSRKQMTSLRPVENPSYKTKKFPVDIYILVFLAVVLFIYIVYLLVKSRSSDISSHPEHTNVDSSEHLKKDFIEDSVIKIGKPPEHTIKLLTGKLKIISPCDVCKMINFLVELTENVAEFNFGRAESIDYKHIQLKLRSVSLKQAKIIWHEGIYTLINYAIANPTKVNGIAMDREETITLEDGYQIEMGEIKFVFTTQE